MAILSGTSTAELKKGFFLGAGFVGALVVIGFATGVIRAAVR